MIWLLLYIVGFGVTMLVWKFICDREGLPYKKAYVFAVAAMWPFMFLVLVDELLGWRRT